MNRFTYSMVALLGILLLPGVAASADPAKDAMQKGKACFEKGDYDGAIAAFTESIRLDPKDASLYSYRGVARFYKRDYDLAIADFTEAIRLDPKSIDYSNRGAAYGCKREHEKALADFSSAIRLDPKNDLAFGGRAATYYDKSDCDKAIADYSEAIRINPKRAKTHYMRGKVFQSKGDLDKAIADFNEAIQLNPEYARAYHFRGTALEQKGDKAKAEADFAQAEKLGYKPQQSSIGPSKPEPNSTADAMQKGKACFEKKDYDGAVAAYSEAITLDPQNAEAYCGRGRLTPENTTSITPLPSTARPFALTPSSLGRIACGAPPTDLRVSLIHRSPTALKQCDWIPSLPMPHTTVASPTGTRRITTRPSPTTRKQFAASRNGSRPTSIADSPITIRVRTGTPFET